jgi:4-alpha-glucanotransferase
MSVKLVFALHFHQPVGNFDSVFEDAVKRCYEPIVAHFERHPGVRAAFHLSGCLLEWLSGHDRKFLDRVFRLIGSGQIEPLGGGFYEPILSVIPREDALEQIALLSAFWKKSCGVTPEGAWLPERVWEPALAELLHEGKIRYTILDDQHVRFSGIVRERMTGLYVTERFGKAVAFFPSDYKLRYLIPFRPMESVREHFASLATLPGDPLLTYGDDAEKFGLWPGTFQWVLVEKWLEQFLSYLEEGKSSVRTIQPGEAFRNHPPAEKVYVPNASYSEMLEWALPAESVPAYVKLRDAAKGGSPDEAVKSFVRGSLWDMFLARYPESDQMLKHVLRTSGRVRALRDKKKRKEAYRSVLRAECNCAYWHGLFGGIYLPHLRHGIFQNVIDADARMNEKLGSKILVERGDYDGDFEDEVVVSSRAIQAFFRPGDAGTLGELDYLPSRYNVANVVSRWRESYHTGNDITHTQEDSDGPPSPHELSVGIRASDLKNWTFDTLPVRSLRDFFAPNSLDPRKIRKLEGMTPAKGRLESWETTSRGWKGRGAIGTVTYEKRAGLADPETVSLSWTVDPSSGKDGTFGTLFAFTLLTPKAEDRRATATCADGKIWTGNPGDEIDREGMRRLSWEDSAFGFGFDLTFDTPARLTTAPIQTMQRSEKGYEAVYQGTMIAATWPMKTMIEGTVKVSIHFRRLKG